MCVNIRNHVFYFMTSSIFSGPPTYCLLEVSDPYYDFLPRETCEYVVGGLLNYICLKKAMVLQYLFVWKELLTTKILD